MPTIAKGGRKIMSDKIKVRKGELMLIKFLGIPILRMLAGLFTRFASDTENSYDDTIAMTINGLIEIISSPDIFEIT